MGRSVMISVKPRFCDLIAREKKKTEVRKTRPKTEIPFKCYIYCTRAKRSEKLYSNGTVIVKDTRKLLDRSVRYPGSKIFQRWNGKVIGEFVCDRVYELVTQSQCGSYYVKGEDQSITNDAARHSCLTLKDMHEYLRSNVGYGWHISDLIIYDKPKDLSDFYRPCIYGEESDVSCFLCDKSGYRPDMHIDCFNKVTRPPQSWCYAEEEKR